MYLQKATGLDEVVCFGINPLIALLEHFEDEFLDLNSSPDSKDNICWNLIKDVSLSTQEALNRLNQTMVNKKKA